MSTNFQDPFEQAVSQRLAKLRAMPVETSQLERSIGAQIPRLQSHRHRWFLPLRPLRAIAASVLLLCGIATVILLATLSSSVDAQAAQMAQVHQDMVSGRIPVMQVGSIEAANRMLNSQSPDAPALPKIPDSHVMACCMKSVHNKKLACVLLKDSNEPVTLAVASAADMQLSAAPTEKRNGISYRVQHVGALNMVMTERDGKWLCLIGKLPIDRLMDMASEVQF